MDTVSKPPEKKRDKAPSSQKFKNVFMEENSSNNPFGPNYFSLPYETKVTYKYNKMKGYIIPEKKDIVRKEDEDGKLIGTMILGFVCGIALGGAGKMIIKRVRPSLHEIFQMYQHWYYPILSSLTTTHAYFVAYDRYNKEVGQYFVNKYLQQAIDNGFEDYEISK